MISWFRNSSLNLKILLLVFAVGVLPLSIAFAVSFAELSKASENQQLYAINQGYNQVYQAVENTLDRVYNISKLLAVDDTVGENIRAAGESADIAVQLSCFDNISSYINSMEMVFEPNSVIFYVDKASMTAGSQSGRFRSISAIRQLDWYSQLETNNGSPTWVRQQEELSGNAYLSVVRELWSHSNYTESLGVLSVTFEKSHLENLLLESSQRQMMYIETSDGRLLAANVPEEELVRLPIEERGRGDSRFSLKTVDESAYLVCSRMTAKTGVFVVSLIPAKMLEQEVTAANIRMIFIYAGICLIGLLAILPLTHSITKRTGLLKEQMIQMQEGIIRKVDGAGDYRDEIGQLITHYNGMVDKMGELMQEQYELGQAKTEAELHALQSQINPHFLYNTLDMINWMAQKNETDNIRNVVQAMSRFYRLVLSKGRDIVTIGDEIKMCEAYMDIQRSRYRGKIVYEAEFDEEICEYLIPKITLQPFLENAIIHGIHEKEDASGVVMLSGWIEDGRIVLSVTDDGKGMSEADRNKPQTGSHYGMLNIAKRLELFYGEKIPIELESSPGIGTCVVISVPAVRRGQEEKA